MKSIKLNLWSCPRNVSTALMYSFAQRDDTLVVDEPLYAHYLSKTGIIHPANPEILQSQENDGEKVVKNEILGDYPEKLIFFKQMTHHLLHLNWDFLSQTTNLIFIRDPKEIILSYSKVREEVNIQDVGVKTQWELYEYLKQKKANVWVLDSRILLQNPENILKTVCEKVGVIFDKKMLTWEKGARKEDGVWAKHWYKNVHNSTGFQTYQPRTQQLLHQYLQLNQNCQFFYQKLTQTAQENRDFIIS